MTAADLSVSVILPVYNAATFIAEAIASIRSQSHPVLEIIVVDDGSTDESADVAANQGADIRIVRLRSNMGPASARNHGISAAHGSVIASLDADDLWPPDALSAMMTRMARPPYPDIVSGAIRVSGAQPPPRPRSHSGKPIEGFALSFGCSIIRRSVFDAIGLLDPDLRFGEDSDWFLRAREHGVPIEVVDSVTLIWRRHGFNATTDSNQTMQVGLDMLKRSLDRRRALNGAARSLGSWLPRGPIGPDATERRR